METDSCPSWAWSHTKRRLAHDDPLFEEGNEVCTGLVKQLPLDDDDEDTPDNPRLSETFSCSSTGCPKVFNRLDLFEAHYNSVHRYMCSACRRVFPSPRLLDIHLLETHDSMFQVLAERQDMYQCLVEGCEKKFCIAEDRRNHLVLIHKYPANFRFNRSKGYAKKKEPAPHSMEVDSAGDKNSISSKLTDTNSSAKHPLSLEPARRTFSHKVPKNITFGHPGEKGFERGWGKRKNKTRSQGSHWHQRAAMDTETTVNIESVSMEDLDNALPEAACLGGR